MNLKNRRLGDILVSKGHITEKQLHIALSIQEKHPDKILGDILLEEGFIDKATLVKSSTIDYRIPLVIDLLKKEGRNTDVLEKLLSEQSQVTKISIVIPSIKIPDIDTNHFFCIDVEEEKVIDITMTLISQEKYKKAIYYILDNITNFIDSENLVYLLTWLYVKTNMLDDAEALNRQMNPNYRDQIEILDLLSYSNLINEKYKESIDYYKILIDKFDQSIDNYFFIGYSFDMLKEYDTSKKFYLKYKKKGNDKNILKFIMERLNNI